MLNTKEVNQDHLLDVDFMTTHGFIVKLKEQLYFIHSGKEGLHQATVDCSPLSLQVIQVWLSRRRVLNSGNTQYSLESLHSQII